MLFGKVRTPMLLTQDEKILIKAWRCASNVVRQSVLRVLRGVGCEVIDR